MSARCEVLNISTRLVCDAVVVVSVQTLTDKEYQRLRDASVAIIREMGVECGGSNVQMAVNPADGEVNFFPNTPSIPSPPLLHVPEIIWLPKASAQDRGVVVTCSACICVHQLLA